MSDNCAPRWEFLLEYILDLLLAHGYWEISDLPVWKPDGLRVGENHTPGHRCLWLQAGVPRRPGPSFPRCSRVRLTRPSSSCGNLAQPVNLPTVRICCAAPFVSGQSATRRMKQMRRELPQLLPGAGPVAGLLPADSLASAFRSHRLCSIQSLAFQRIAPPLTAPRKCSFRSFAFLPIQSPQLRPGNVLRVSLHCCSECDGIIVGNAARLVLPVAWFPQSSCETCTGISQLSAFPTSQSPCIQTAYRDCAESSRIHNAYIALTTKLRRALTALCLLGNQPTPLRLYFRSCLSHPYKVIHPLPSGKMRFK